MPCARSRPTIRSLRRTTRRPVTRRAMGAITVRRISRQLGQQDDPDSRVGKRVTLEVGGDKDRRRRASLPRSFSLPATRRGRGDERDAPARQPVLDGRFIGPRSRRAIGPGCPEADRGVIELDHRHDLGRGADQDQLVGRLQLVQGDCALDERDVQRADQAGGPAAGSSPAGSRGLRACPRDVLPGPRAATCASPRSQARAASTRTAS